MTSRGLWPGRNLANCYLCWRWRLCFLFFATRFLRRNGAWRSVRTAGGRGRFAEGNRVLLGLTTGNLALEGLLLEPRTYCSRHNLERAFGLFDDAPGGMAGEEIPSRFGARLADDQEIKAGTV